MVLRPVVNVLLITVLFSDFDHSFAVLLNFCNFHNFSNFCFAVFRHVSQIMLCKISQILFSQFYLFRGFANMSFAIFSKPHFRKNEQISFSSCNLKFSKVFARARRESGSATAAARVGKSILRTG